METRFDILNELQNISPTVAAIERVNVFSVPQGYFDTISDTILVCIKEESGELSQVDTNNIPQGYFDGLASSILDRIKAEQNISASDEIKELSPTLYNIQHKNVFEVPVNYFSSLPETIVSKTKQKGKVVSMASRITKYAVAAMLTGAMALGVYKFTDKQPGVIIQPSQTVATTLDPVIEQGKDMNDKQFNETLNNLSGDAIAKYLEKNGDEKDIELLAANIGANSLPSEDDYMVDEKALENYLTDIDKEAGN